MLRTMRVWVVMLCTLRVWVGPRSKHAHVTPSPRRCFCMTAHMLLHAAANT